MLGNVAWSAGTFIVMILILVTVHEYGHFRVARWFGVTVERFSVGFGPILWRHKARDGVEYALSLIPLGGYTKMLGETDGDVPLSEQAHAFLYQPAWKRVLIAVAGPAANVLLAVLMYWMATVIGVPAIKPQLAAPAPGSAAAAAGLVKGDVILRGDGHAVRSWQEVRVDVLGSIVRRKPYEMQVRDPDGQVRHVTLDVSGLGKVAAHPAEAAGLGLDWPVVPPVVGSTAPGSGAARAGLRHGDRVTALGGQPIHTWEDLDAFARQHPDKTVEVTVDRAGQTLDFSLTIGSRTENGKVIGVMGIVTDLPRHAGADLLTVNRASPLEAIPVALRQTWDMSELTVLSFWQMVTGDLPARDLSGPIRIAQMGGQAAHYGLSTFLTFLALISVNLGLVNLVPLPVLDGGQIVVSVGEALVRKRMTQRVLTAWSAVGLVILLAVTGFSFYNDLSNLL